MKIYCHYIMKLVETKYLRLLVLIIQLFGCAVWAQTPVKRQLTVKDYALWQILNLNKLSPNGQWVSYGIRYQDKTGRDTLFVKNTRSMKILAFAEGRGEEFINAEQFLYYTSKGLHIVELESGQQQLVAGALKHVFFPASGQLLVLVKRERDNLLLLRNASGSEDEQIVGVNEFLIDPTGERVLYTTSLNGQHSVSILELPAQRQKTVLCNGPSPFTNLVWQSKGKAVAFLAQAGKGGSANNIIYYYTLGDKKLRNFDPELQVGFPKDSLLLPNTRPITGTRLKISDDMQRIFFTVQPNVKTGPNLQGSPVQLWNGNAKWIYPMEEFDKRFSKNYLGMWQPSEKTFRLISNDSLPEFMLTGDQKYAILSNPKQYDPQYTYDGFRDFYLVELATGKKDLLLKEQYGHPYSTVPSPGGKYIAYFKDKHWWVYDIDEKRHVNITKGVGQSFFDNDKQRPQVVDTYPHLGWTVGDKQILLCDAYDIWAISPDGSSARRLTSGRESQTQFRLAGIYNSPISKGNYSGIIHEAVDLSKGLLLESKNGRVISGFYKWSVDGNQQLVSSNHSRLDYFKQSAEGHTFAYLEQRYDLPPRIMVRPDAANPPRLLVEANPQHRQFYWGRSELIQYKNSKGETLSGALYYPAGYDSQKKYPMIVHIYEKLSQHLHDYVIPSQFTGDNSVNISTYTTQGYFVFTPDISYEIGDVGVSAADCVISATKHVIALGLVKPDKIGLSGHSFGGYETNFIITQTNLFAAAVSGAGWADLTSAYLTVGWNNGRADIWRFESQQLRMKASLFEDQEGYDRNSPIRQIKKVTTPLLSWSGREDVQVNWSNTVSLYLAMRRLQKKHIMLLYPGEGHNLNNPKNQLDLSVRVHEWFDYHLKDAPAAAWIAEGLK